MSTIPTKPAVPRPQPSGKPKKSRYKLIADNRRARYNYEIGDVIEAGIVLTGTEVKSLRIGKAQIAESYASNEDGELFLINATIPEYLQANRFNHEPKRPRKLLLHAKQIDRLFQAIAREGMTVVPLKLFFNDQGRAKVEIALAKGKKLHDKRDTEKSRDWEREKGRLLRDRG
jgi:SsrA-binding protein